MFVSLFSGMAVAVDETEPDEEVVLAESSAEVSFEPKESNISDVFNSRLYVEKNEAAGLASRVDVKLDLLGATGTLYLPGKADASQLRFAWDAEGVTVTKDGVAYESGTAPVPAAGESAVYKISKGYAFAYLTVKTVNCHPHSQIGTRC